MTLQKIDLIRGKKEVLDALLKLIPIENIPPEYGGKSMPLGESPEEVSLRNLMEHNLNRSKGDKSCGGENSGSLDVSQNDGMMQVIFAHLFVRLS